MQNQNKTNKQMNRPKEHPQTKQSSVHNHTILTIINIQVYFVGESSLGLYKGA